MGTALSPEDRAALVNGIVVLCLPPLAITVLTLLAHNDPAIGGAAHPPDWSPWPGAMMDIVMIAGSAGIMLPWALVAAWRTWVHAHRWESGDRGWRGIAEAGICGLGAALLVLLPGTIRSPGKAPPYLVAYGGLGLIVGLAIGLVLFVTARLVLGITHRPPTAA